MAKKKIEKIGVELRKLLVEKKLILGAERTLKYLKLGKLKMVYVSRNCAKMIKDDLAHDSRLAKVEFKQLDNSSSELGVFCKKPFPVAVVGVLK
ncbi:MAG: ribosomal L7Ae/L30e/S12e/Gadd45 family protein [Candidatus Woesearchaeota archaeon]